MLKARKDVHDLVENIEVHWYDSCRPRKVLSAKYRPVLIGSPRPKHGALWKDIIRDDSVVVKLPSLKRSRELPVRAQNLITSNSTVLHANADCQSTMANGNGA